MSVPDFEAETVIDARDCILGRVASEVAERALDGERVAVINAEQSVITGREEQLVEKYQTRREVGSDRGPYYPKQPDRIFKRSIRGMLPYKKPRGREAYENVRVYKGNPNDEDGEIIEGTSLDRLSNIKFVQLGTISEQLGANVTW
ncbi:50S ribosomal protein L13 [Halorientalis litorea]|jgi:large subunit ribosomal protein L13|uniref:50S ribosomal protein L13 n=1 Tax=Halorientalis litorea TaxID=2931977 RepID=UPI001FF64098|nr:50S ribosomal protein L13 [Halorientalis litorea]